MKDLQMKSITMSFSSSNMSSYRQNNSRVHWQCQKRMHYVHCYLLLMQWNRIVDCWYKILCWLDILLKALILRRMFFAPNVGILTFNRLIYLFDEIKKNIIHWISTFTMIEFFTLGNASKLGSYIDNRITLPFHW